MDPQFLGRATFHQPHLWREMTSKVSEAGVFFLPGGRTGGQVALRKDMKQA